MPASTFKSIIGADMNAPNEPTENKFSIYKTDDEKRLVFGWASIIIKTDGEQLVDRQQDLIDPEDLEEAAYEYVLNFRDTGEKHDPNLRKKGKLVESCVLTAEKQKAMGILDGTLPIGWWIGFKIEDDEAWEKVKNGTYRMFSIEGKANRMPVEKGEVAKSFTDVLKFNPFHDAKGRFASSNGFATYSANPKTKAGAMAISRSAQAGHGTTFNSHKESQGENINQNYRWLNGGPGAKQLAAQGQLASQQPQKPQKNYDSKGYADYDDADFHQLYNGRQYFQQQQLDAKQQAAAQNYLEDFAESGSMYSHSQNMNYMMANGQKLTGKYKQTHDGLMSAMHNVGYNVTLTRYDHDDMINGLLKAAGAGSNYQRMSQSAIQKALVGKTVNENKFLSTSYNNFQNARNASTFTSRAVKINYKVKADAQAMMPGVGNGGDFGEMVLAPTNGTANRGGKIVGVRFTGQMARVKGTQSFTQKQIEIDIEI